MSAETREGDASAAPRIAAVFITLNEEDRLRPALESVRDWVDEIVVADMHSEDGTAALAREYGARVLMHERLGGNPDPAKKTAVLAAQAPWVIMLDADERVPDTLAGELRRIAREDAADGVVVGRKHLTFRTWLRHGGWWKVDQVKFFKKERVVWGWEQRIHCQPVIDGRLLALPRTEALSLVHENFRYTHEYAERCLNRYARADAEERLAAGERFSPARLVWRPLRQFMVMYVAKGGFLDGMGGLAMALEYSFYQLQVQLNLWSLRQWEAEGSRNGEGETVKSKE